MENDLLLKKIDDLTEVVKSISDKVNELHAVQVGTLIENFSKEKKLPKKELERLKKIEDDALIEKLRNNAHRNILNKG